MNRIAGRSGRLLHQSVKTLNDSIDTMEVDPVKLVEIYTTAGQYYATVLIAVVFAQFSDLALLLGKAYILSSFSVSFFVVVYAAIVIAGMYFGYEFLRFARLLDGVIKTDSKTDGTVLRLANEVGRPHLRYRSWVTSYSGFPAISVYIFLSAMALIAALLLN